MQDYNYRMTSCFEITIEMGCWKYPMPEMLRILWTQHKFSLLRYMELVRSYAYECPH
jgi:carboxypeptidase D